MKKLVMLIVALLVCVINPMVFATGCGGGWGLCGEAPEFAPEYSEQDMLRELRKAPMTHVIELMDGSSLEVTFTIDEESVAFHRPASSHSPGIEWFNTAMACSFIEPSVVASFTGTLTLTHLRDGLAPEVLASSIPLDGQHTFYQNSNEQLYMPTTLRVQTDSFGYDRGVELGNGEWMAFNMFYETTTGRGEDLALKRAELIKTMPDGGESMWASH